MRRLLAVGVATVILGGCGLRDSFIRDETVVARAADHELTVGELAEILTQGQYLPVRMDLVERWARWWVEFSLYVQRVEAGDSLRDSATVLRARWPDAQHALVDSMYARLAQARLPPSAERVDSVYEAGDLRLIHHILVRASADLSERDRAERRRRAEALRASLTSGTPWSVANAANDDPLAAANGGSVGVIGRGFTEPAFEAAAFALEPGELSPVVESTFGYHIVRRPPLEEIREVYTVVVRDSVFARMREAYEQELAAKWEIRLDGRAATIIRDAGDRPYRAKQSPERIGTYRGGSFTSADLVRWLQVLPAERHEWITGATDAELNEWGTKVIGYEVEWIEAQNTGIQLSDSAFNVIKLRLDLDLAKLQRVLAVDSIRQEARSADEAAAAPAIAVSVYLGRLADAARSVDVALVPPFLVDKLQEEATWWIRYAALDRVLERARELRAAADSAARAGAAAGG